MKHKKIEKITTHFNIKEYLFVYKFLKRFCESTKIEASPHSSGGFSFIKMVNPKLDHQVIAKLKHDFTEQFNANLLLDNSCPHTMIVSKVV